MANGEKLDPPVNGWDEMSVRFVGQFIFWAVIGLVGWLFYSTVQHETSIQLLKHRVCTLEKCNEKR